MIKKRKITVTVRRTDLEAAQAYTGKGITETVLEGLRTLASIQGQPKLRGKATILTNPKELRRDRE